MGKALGQRGAWRGAGSWASGQGQIGGGWRRAISKALMCAWEGEAQGRSGTSLVGARVVSERVLARAARRTRLWQAQMMGRVGVADRKWDSLEDCCVELLE